MVLDLNCKGVQMAGGVRPGRSPKGTTRVHPEPLSRTEWAAGKSQNVSAYFGPQDLISRGPRDIKTYDEDNRTIKKGWRSPKSPRQITEITCGSNFSTTKSSFWVNIRLVFGRLRKRHSTAGAVTKFKKKFPRTLSLYK